MHIEQNRMAGTVENLVGVIETQEVYSLGFLLNRIETLNKKAFQQDAYRPFVVRGGVPEGAFVSGGVCAHPLDPEADTPPLQTEGITDACENISLPQTSFAGGNYNTYRRETFHIAASEVD